MGELKRGWRRLRFDQMVTSAGATRKARGWSAGASGVDRYVGIEHLDPNSPSIRRWGSPDDVGENSDLRHFEPGDVILARRGIEQRKVGFATFSGVASGHALVFRARSGVLLPEFLPFLLLSDHFMGRVDQFSAGSLSKTVNLSSLLRLEFAVPPLEEQRRLSAFLSAATEVADEFQTVFTSGEAVQNSLVEDCSNRASHHVVLGEVLESIAYGTSSRSVPEKKATAVLRIPNVLRGTLDLTDLNYVELDDSAVERWSVRAGDVLMVRTNGNPEHVGRCVVAPTFTVPTVFASYLLRLRFDTARILPEFAALAINAPFLRRKLRGNVRSSAGNYNVNTDGVRRQAVPLPSLMEQGNVIEQVAAVGRQVKAARSRATAARALVQQWLAAEKIGI